MNNNIDESGLGIDLDKLKVPGTDSVPSPEKLQETKPVEDPKRESEIKPKVKHEKRIKKRLKPIIIVMIIAVLFVTVAFFIWQKKFIRPSSSLYLEREVNSSELSNTYLNVGPIITNLDETRNIKISLIVKYNSELMKQASVMDSIIRNNILMFLASSGTKKIVKETNPKILKVYFKNEITRLLKLESVFIDEVIFKEITVF